MNIEKYLLEENYKIIISVLDKNNIYLGENEKNLLIWYYPYYQRTISILIIIKMLIDNNLFNNSHIPILESFSEELTDRALKSIKLIHNIYPIDGPLQYGIGLLGLGMGAGTLRNSIDFIVDAIKNNRDIREEEITEWKEAQTVITQEWFTFLTFLVDLMKENAQHAAAADLSKA